TIQLRRISTTYFRQQAFPAHNLDQMLQAIDDSDLDYTYSVAWIDPMAKGKNLGRGVLTTGNHAGVYDLPEKLKDQPLKIGKKPKLSVPFYLPEFALNSLT